MPICPACNKAYLITSHEIEQSISTIWEVCLSCGFKNWIKRWLNI